MNTAKIIDLPVQQPYTPNGAWPFKIDHVENWAFQNGVFTKKECEELIELGNKKLIKAHVIGGDQSVRDSQVAWLYASDGLEWAFRRLTDVSTSLNDQFFKFDLFGFCEGLQFTRYDAPAGKYDAHIDKIFNGVVRKLSFSVQLSDPDNYEGGDLALHLGAEATKVPKEQGKLVAFPSYALHSVQPVTKGTRYSLVAWIAGPPFK